MKKLELIKLIKEEIRFLKEENKISDKLYNDIIDYEYTHASIGLRYARLAYEVFKDTFRREGKVINSNTFFFKDPEMLATFVDNLVHSGISENEIEFS